MIKITDKRMCERLMDGSVSMEELADFLLENFPIKQIAAELAGYYIDEQEQKNNMIILSQKQWDLFFDSMSKVMRLKDITKGRKPSNPRTIAEREEYAQAM